MKLRKRLNLLQRYLSGKTNEQQHQVIDEWYHAVDDSKPIGLWNQQGRKSAVKGSIQLQILDRINKPKVVAIRSRTAAAACILVLVASALWLYMINHNKQPAIYYTVSAPFGDIKQIQLPDNSRVWLKSGTTLKYSSLYGMKARYLELIEGEAFFEVQHDITRPFIVKAGQLETKVLGTAFNIKAYSDGPSIQVWVQQGRVQVSDSIQVLTELSRGKRFQWDRKDGHSHIDSLDWKQVQAWQQGVLLLESTTFNELAFELREVYGVTLVTNNAGIRRLHYDAKFFIHKTSVNDIIATLAEVHDIRYKIQGKTITLY